MGLLDDAIREHLELKRRRGANPDEVAREQREALDVAANRRVATADADDSDPSAPAPRAAAIDSTKVDENRTSGADDPATDPAPAQAEAAAAGETAELDMSSVLGERDDGEDRRGLPAETDAGDQSTASARPVPARPATEEDSLEWEVPGDAAEQEPEDPAEDVLEETPDFLRDTPEQDRLWFEQRPPRDFDFDK
jgi:hypothetical protein